MSRRTYRQPVQSGAYWEALYHPHGRVFPQGRRRWATQTAAAEQWADALTAAERRLLSALTRRTASASVGTLSADCDLPPDEVRALLARFLALGLVVVEEENIRRTAGIQYQIERAHLAAEADAKVEVVLGVLDQAQRWDQAVETLYGLLDRLEAQPTHPLVTAWGRVLTRHLRAIDDGRLPALTDEQGTIAQFPGAKYLTIMGGVVGLVATVACDRFTTLREISTRFCGRSRALDPYGHELARVMGCPLEDLGLLTPTPQVHLRIPARVQVAGRPLWLDAGDPHVILSETTCERMSFERVVARAILAVENAGAFRHLVEKTGLPKGVGCIWLHGQRGLERRVLQALVRCRPIPVYVWTDLDIWGVYIQQAVAAALEGLTHVIPVHASPAAVMGAQRPQQPTEWQHYLLSQVDRTSPWWDLVRALQDFDTWVDQTETLETLATAADVAALLRP